MFRYFLIAAAAALVLATPVEAKRAPFLYLPMQRLLRADVAVVGKVTAIEKDTVDATSAPGDRSPSMMATPPPWSWTRP